jgi:DNA-binding CsgD family transcriptional regulator
MTHAGSGLPTRFDSPALVLLDASLKPVCYNAEAIKVLTYPKDSSEIPNLASHIETRLGSVLAALGAPRERPSNMTLQSGRRQYVVRCFALNGLRSASADRRQPQHALLLERRASKAVNLSAIVAQFRLTPRELETLRFLVQGLTTKEIAEQMDISPQTVKAFLRLVMIKMQVSTRSGIVGKIVRIS